MKIKQIKVIFDTNVWISFLIGKKMTFLKDLIVNERIKIIIANQLLNEIQLVTKREKLAKYFPKSSVDDLINLLNQISENYTIKPKFKICRDTKDNFLIDLSNISKADYLITGDKDLLELNPFKKTKIISPVEFEKIFE